VGSVYNRPTPLALSLSEAKLAKGQRSPFTSCQGVQGSAVLRSRRRPKATGSGRAGSSSSAQNSSSSGVTTRPNRIFSCRIIRSRCSNERLGLDPIRPASTCPCHAAQAGSAWRIGRALEREDWGSTRTGRAGV